MIDTPLQPAIVEQQESTQTTFIGSVSEFLTTLINTCVAQQELVVLLFDDDYGMTDGTLQKEISSLINHLPYRMHIVISTRVSTHVPLSQLYERDRIVEVRMNASGSATDGQQNVHTDSIKHLEEYHTFPVSPTHKKQTHQEPEMQRPPQPLLDPLSTRELEVLQLMAQGASNVEIADALIIAFATVKRHVSNILSKLQATNRTQAVAYARRLSLLY